MLKFQNQTHKHMKDYSKKLDAQVHEFCIESQSYNLSIKYFVHVLKQIIHDKFNEVFIVHLRISKLKIKIRFHVRSELKSG